MITNRGRARPMPGVAPHSSFIIVATQRRGSRSGNGARASPLFFALDRSHRRFRRWMITAAFSDETRPRRLLQYRQIKRRRAAPPVARLADAVLRVDPLFFFSANFRKLDAALPAPITNSVGVRMSLQNGIRRAGLAFQAVSHRKRHSGMTSPICAAASLKIPVCPLRTPPRSDWLARPQGI